MSTGRTEVDDTGPLDLLFVVGEKNRGWILHAICQEIEARFPGRSAYHFVGSDSGSRVLGAARRRLGRPLVRDIYSGLPSASTYFFPHYVHYVNCRSQPMVRNSTSIVFFHHPYPDVALEVVAKQLRSATRVLFQASGTADAMVQAGFPAHKAMVVLAGADPDRFPGHARGDGAVGFCAAYYPRKNPATIAAIVRAMPHRQFRLLGRSWRRSPDFASLEALENFSYVEAAYDDYGSFYASIDVLVSAASLEGGPIPMLEAMMANVVPVCTRTGFAPDLIEDGVNGFLCDVGAPVGDFTAAIERAFRLRTDVRATVDHLTWDLFAAKVLAAALTE